MSSGYSFTFILENNLKKESYKVRFRQMIFSLRNSYCAARFAGMEFVSHENTLYNNVQNVPTKKRNYSDSFGDRDYEFERYGQEITSDFFQNNIGHVVIG